MSTDFFLFSNELLLSSVIDSDENDILVHDSTKFLIFVFFVHIGQT